MTQPTHPTQPHDPRPPEDPRQRPLDLEEVEELDPAEVEFVDEELPGHEAWRDALVRWNS